MAPQPTWVSSDDLPKSNFKTGDSTTDLHSRPSNHELFLPYHRDASLSPPLWLQIPLVLIGLLLVPLRFLLGTFFLFLSWLIALFCQGRRGRYALRFGARILLFFLGFHWIRATVEKDEDEDEWRRRVGDEGPRKEEVTVVSNHVSMVDPLMGMWLWGGGFVAKANVARIPAVGAIAKVIGCLFVDRVGGKGRVAKRLGKRQRQGGGRLVIFPEGTTTNGKYLLRFRTGAFVEGLPVRPVLLRYPYKWFSPSYENIRWWKLVLGLLMQIRNRVEYVQMKVYYPSEEEKKNPRLYADNVRSLMARRGGLTLSDASFSDKLEFHHIVRGDPMPKRE